MHEALWSLLGVLVGVALTEITAWAKARRVAKSLRKALDGEINSISRMIPSKKKTLNEAQTKLAALQFLNPASTHFPRGVYEQLLLVAPQSITPQERDCLHIIYEHLRVIDNNMDNLEGRFISIKEATSINQAVQMAGGTLDDLFISLDTCKNLIESVLQKKPIVVYGANGS